LEKLITINIFGQTFNFRAGPEVVNADAVAEFLENEIKRIENQKNGRLTEINKFTILLSVALNMVNENVKLKNRQSSLIQDISKRSANLVRMLDTAA